MEENNQRKQEIAQKKLIQEMKDEEKYLKEINYPSPISKAGAKIMGEPTGQGITLRTGPIKSNYTKQTPNEQ